MEDNIKCPITMQIMKEPVLAFDGIAYERTAIEEWLGKNNTSPITREKIKKDLIPIIHLKNYISDYIKEHPESRDDVYKLERKHCDYRKEVNEILYSRKWEEFDLLA